MKAKKTIVVGLSGGVDSSVAALILKEQGHNVIGMFMKNWNEENADGHCTAEEDYKIVEKVCEILEIPCYSIDFSKQYWDHVFADFLKEYESGYTPNPDILCNREIKFKVFFEEAMKLGADYLATGHYAQDVRDDAGRALLGKGADPNKDQSYFLYTLKESILQKVLFPIGDIHKPLVREMAAKAGLPTHDRKDSTGICFIGERHFKSFLSQYLKPRTGEFRTLDEKVVGHHDGIQFYTIGQRKGLGLGGPGEPWFVVGKNVRENVVYVVRGENHPALFHSNLVANELSFVADFGIESNLPFSCKAKVRYRQQDQDCVIEKMDLNSDSVLVRFLEPQRAITPRQSIVFYKDNICLGGGMIREYY